MKLAVIIAAAGAGERYRALSRAGRSKLDEAVGDRSVLQRSVELFSARAEVGAIIVGAPHDAELRAQFDARHADTLGVMGATVVTGGKDNRSDTIAAALARVPEEATHVAVHDAARPCTPAGLIDRLVDAAADHPAVVPGLPVADTLKRVDAQSCTGEAPDPIDAVLGLDAGPKIERVVEATVDRGGLYTVQTPQVFAVDLLRRAHAQGGDTCTDDAQLVERLGERVLVIDGDVRNIKITTPADLELARLILGVGAAVGRPAHKRF